MRKQDGIEETNHPNRTTSIRLPIPSPDPGLFKHAATSDILRLLVDNPYRTFTIRELGRLTDHSTYAVKSAVDVLEANEIVVTEREGNRRPVGINRSHLENPNEPALRVPQAEYQAPVREVLNRIRDELKDVRGVLVFGSVARGDADRQSDIDLWVLVEESTGEQHQANELAKELGQERFDGDRYEFQILVETIESAQGYGNRLVEILTEGITLYETEALRAVKEEVLGDV